VALGEQVLRRISKRPRNEVLAKQQHYETAQDEWDDFLAPTCALCGLGTDNDACKCDQLVANAEAFLAPEGDCNEPCSSASSDTTLQDGDQDVFPQKMSP
jgi:hypothetical protein